MNELYSCDLHLGDSRLQCKCSGSYVRVSCDLHLGDSRLQSSSGNASSASSCDLHLGDSRLQFHIFLNKTL